MYSIIVVLPIFKLLKGRLFIEFKNCYLKRCENCGLKSIVEICVFSVYKIKKNVFGIMV